MLRNYTVSAKQTPFWRPLRTDTSNGQITTPSRTEVSQVVTTSAHRPST